MVRRLSSTSTAGQSRVAQARQELGVAISAQFTRDENGERDERRARQRRHNAQRRQRAAHPQRDLGVHRDQRGGIHVAPIQMAGHIEVIKLVAEISVVLDAGEDVQQEFGGTQGNQKASGERWKRRTRAFLMPIGNGVLMSDGHDQGSAPEVFLSWFPHESEAYHGRPNKVLERKTTAAGP